MNGTVKKQPNENRQSKGNTTESDYMFRQCIVQHCESAGAIARRVEVCFP